MSIGYACHALAVPGTQIKKCLLRNATRERLKALVFSNLNALDTMIDNSIAHGILLLRISSDIIPFASSPANTLPWEILFGEHLAAIGGKIRASGMRVSMHPGQYTVLNSPDAVTAGNAIAELEYHARFLDSLGVDAGHKIVLHIGGVYGDKGEAMNRFLANHARLRDEVRRRLVIENDDRSYNVSDVLAVSRQAGIPVVFDTLHHTANPPPFAMSEQAWIRLCGETWKPEDGRQKIHYSQGNPARKPGAHSASIALAEFLAFHDALGPDKPDIMLEVKDKNISARKCVLATAQPGQIGRLEKEWGRYKYLVLEHSQAAYQAIRALLKNKDAYPVLPFFRLVEDALALPADSGSMLNAINHVWGYFKDLASPAQKKAFTRKLGDWADGKVPLASVKRALYTLAQIHRQDYLLESYYFVSAAGVPAGED